MYGILEGADETRHGERAVRASLQDALLLQPDGLQGRAPAIEGWGSSGARLPGLPHAAERSLDAGRSGLVTSAAQESDQRFQAVTQSPAQLGRHRLNIQGR